ncbi:MAG: ABC transporter permease [Candidatus Solibacter usitatus]|nr:ABC transporter permease [Candidatus Solibacter usitatus]
MNVRRTRAVALKEMRHVIRDPRSLGMALAVPLLFLLLFGFALSLDVDHIPMLVYDADHSAESRALIQRFQASRFFTVVGFVDSYGEIEKAINSSRVLIAVAVQRDFSRHVAAGQEADVQILVDGSDSNTASIAKGYAEAVVAQHALEVRSGAQNFKGGQQGPPAVDSALRVWYNPELESKNYVVPGLIAVILMIIAALLTSLTIAREWEMGTMEQLLSTPLRPSEMVFGKMLAYFAVGLADMLIVIALGMGVFQVPLRGSVPLLLGTGCIFLFGSLFWGILLSALTRSQLMAYQMGILTSFLPAFMLSGFIYSIENMPRVIQVISVIVPARYFVTILKGIYLKGVGVSVLWPQILFLIAYTTLVFFLATRKLKQKMA